MKPSLYLINSSVSIIFKISSLEAHLRSNTSSLLIVKSAILRRESRGAHFRSDFPESLDAWKRSIILNKNKIKFEAR